MNKEEIKTIIWEALMDKYEYVCLQDTDFSLVYSCPYYVYDDNGGCKGCCNHGEFFEKILDKLTE